MKEHPIDHDLMTICREIVTENLSEEQWAEIESCDMFQRGGYCGGFDADDVFFNFSYYDEHKIRWCFSLTLDEVNAIHGGTKNVIEIEKWDDLWSQFQQES